MTEDHAAAPAARGEGLRFEISVEDHADLKARSDPIHLLDVREPWEIDLCRIDGSLDIPLDELAGRADEIPLDAQV